MNRRDYIALGFAFLVCSLVTSAQVSDGNLPVSLFGEPFRNPCVVGRDSGKVRSCRYYNFNEDYAVGVEADTNGDVLKAYLIPKGDEVSSPISSEEKQKFLDKIAHVRKFGPVRFAGKTSMLWGVFGADSWEVHENAFVAYGYKRADDSSGLTAIFVYFPFKITGHVSSVESFDVGSKGNKLLKIEVDGMKYLSSEITIKSGSINTVAVVNP